VERQRSKESCYFVSQLISVVSQCEMRAEFVLLGRGYTIRGYRKSREGHPVNSLSLGE